MIGQREKSVADEVSCDSSSSSPEVNFGDGEGNTSSRHDSDNCGHSTSSGSMGKELSEVEAIAREDTRMLRTWRRMVAIIFLCAFGIVLAGAITFLKRSEEEANYNKVSSLVSLVLFIFL